VSVGHSVVDSGTRRPPNLRAGAARSFVRLSLHQARFDLRAFFRNRQSRFFTLALPVIFLVIFSSVFGGHHDTVKVPGGRIDTSVYYVSGIMALGVISASFVNLVISVTVQRETGVLKRRRSTPIAAGSIIAGRALTAVVTTLLITGILLGIGWAFFKAHVPAHTAPALIVTIALGAVVFCCLGYALASVIHNDEAAQPITQAVMLPLYFISGVFVPISTLPHWLVEVAKFFPVRHLAAALLAAYNPHTRGTGFSGGDLLVLGIWGLAGLVVAIRRFSWLPVKK
jgi:ABC-2 type transport system permease protein